MHPSDPERYSPGGAELPALESTLGRLLRRPLTDASARKDLAAVLEEILNDGLDALPASPAWSDLVSDGLSISEPCLQRPDRVTVQGGCYWLAGGVGAERFRFDVDPSRSPLRYSFKFTGGRRDHQVLYLAKCDEGGYANATGVADSTV